MIVTAASAIVFFGLDQATWTLLATVASGVGTVALATVAGVTLRRSRREREFAAAPVMRIESGLNEAHIQFLAEGKTLRELAGFPVRINNWGSGDGLHCTYGAYGSWMLRQDDGSTSAFERYYITAQFDVHAGGTQHIDAFNQSGFMTERLVPAHRLQGRLGIVEVVSCRDRLGNYYEFVRYEEDAPIVRRIRGPLRSKVQLRWSRLLRRARRVLPGK